MKAFLVSALLAVASAKFACTPMFGSNGPQGAVSKTFGYTRQGALCPKDFYVYQIFGTTNQPFPNAPVPPMLEEVWVSCIGKNGSETIVFDNNIHALTGLPCNSAFRSIAPTDISNSCRDAARIQQMQPNLCTPTSKPFAFPDNPAIGGYSFVDVVANDFVNFIGVGPGFGIGSLDPANLPQPGQNPIKQGFDKCRLIGMYGDDSRLTSQEVQRAPLGRIGFAFECPNDVDVKGFDKDCEPIVNKFREKYIYAYNQQDKYTGVIVNGKFIRNNQ